MEQYNGTENFTDKEILKILQAKNRVENEEYLMYDELFKYSKDKSC